MSEIKVYVVVNSGTLTPTENQWRVFFQQAATKPLSSAIIQAALRNITGTNQQKFVGVLLAEMKESAIDLGFSVAQSNQISMAIVGFGDRATAISQVQAYLAANAGIWYP